MSTLRNLTPSILLISLLLPLQLFDAAVAKESKKGAKKPDQAAARALKKKIEELSSSGDVQTVEEIKIYLETYKDYFE